MKRWLLPICVFATAQPAFADKLTVAEVYRNFQGDWEGDWSSNDGSCRSGVRRLALDADGLGLLIQDIEVDGSVFREFRYRLLAAPSEDDKSIFLEFLGPEVDRSTDSHALRHKVSLSMTDLNHLTEYFGFVYSSNPLDLRPHGAEGDLIRCR